MNENSIYQLLLSEANGSLSTTEIEDLAVFRASNPVEVAELKSLISSTQGISLASEEDILNGWQQVLSQLDTEVVNEPTKTLGQRKWFAIAASLAILAIAYFSFRTTDVSHLSENEIDRVTLIDGTAIALNSHSEAVIKKGYNESSRNLTVDGEIYLDVKSNEAPMKITSDQFDILVTGTKFNVMDYSRDRISTVTLYEGEIEIVLPTDEKLVLHAGDHVCWNKKLKTIERSQLSESSPSWLEGRLNFDNTLFAEVFTRLEHMYDVTFDQTEDLDKLHFKYEPKTQELDEILSQIQTATNTIIVKTGNNGYTIEAKG